MKYSMYNVVWYDGADAYVTKWILPSNVQQAMSDILEYWEKNGYDGEVLKLDKLYEVSLDNIISFKNYGDVREDTIIRFEEMYF